MHKKTAKNYHLTNRRSRSPPKEPPRSPSTKKMTILQRRRGGGLSPPSITPAVQRVNGTKSRSSTYNSWGNDDDDDDDDLQTDDNEAASWSEDAEDATSRKTLECWLAIERMLHQEDDKLPQGPLYDECLQWRSQLSHLRINAGVKSEADKVVNGGKVDLAAAAAATTKKMREPSAKIEDRIDELDVFSREPASSIRPPSQQHRQAREEVLDHLVEYVCRELAEIEAEKEAEERGYEDEEVSNELTTEYLRIAPAPKSLDKPTPLVSNNFHYGVDEGDDSSRRQDQQQQQQQQQQERRRGSRDQGRNRLGTVFNERIIVSPVPFVETTRQSFTTLHKTPIQCAIGDNHRRAYDRSGSRRDSSCTRRRKLSRATPAPARVLLLPAWHGPPVCPTVWPKSSVKLTPIDTTRLPSSKRRPAKTADSVLPQMQQRRSRNSLSPIAVQPLSPRLCDRYRRNRQHDALAIRGSHIEAQTPLILGGKSINKAARAKRQLPAN